MSKKGQVSIFVIVGIILVVIVGLLYFLNNQGVVPIFGVQNLLDAKLDPIKDELTRCANEGVEEGMNILGKQGGDFTPNTFLKYNNYNVPYYCLYSDNGCINNMPFLPKIESDFEEYMINYMGGCVNENVFEDGIGYEVTTGERMTEVSFNNDAVEIDVDYGVHVKKGDTSISLGDFKIVVGNTPMEELYSVAHDIIDELANDEIFDQLNYMIEKKGAYFIEVDKPYPDVVYRVYKNQGDFELWFAVQGEEEFIL